MFSGHRRYALFIGRWQPFHNGHKYIIDKALREKKPVCIAIRDTEISEQNPFSVAQRMEMIKKVYGDKVKNIVKNTKLVYLKSDLKTCEKRDKKGMYKKARKGLIKQFTGISAPFEIPRNADVVVNTAKYDEEYCVKKILFHAEIT